MENLTEEILKKVLKDFGLTEFEAEVYLFLSKHNAMKGTEVSREIKKDKGQVYHILRSLQAKGLVESTLEAPVRFVPVPFEDVVESTIRAKKEETARIESAKKELVDYWKKLGKNSLESAPEKFTVIEGRYRVYAKISQMIAETKNQLSAITTVTSMLRADQHGVYDIANEVPSGTSIDFRFLTELSLQDVTGMRAILRGMAKRGFNFRGRNPVLGQSLFPRMVIRDDEETIFFLTPRAPALIEDKDDLCLWTNSRDLVQALTIVFEDFWRNSIDIKSKILELRGKSIPNIGDMTKSNVNKELFDKTLETAKDSVFLITTAEGLLQLTKEQQLLNKWITEGICVQIMAPIVTENLKAAQQLSESFLVRHTPASYLNTALIDGQHLFQFKNPSSDLNLKENLANSQDTFYSNDSGYLERTKNMLNDLWKNAHVLSEVTVLSLNDYLSPGSPYLPKKESEYTKMMGWLDYPKHGVVSEKEILTKITEGKRFPATDPTKDVVRYYGSRGVGIFHPPANFKLPDLIIIAFRWNENSSFGVENRLMISMKVDKATGHSFVPVASIGDNRGAMEFLKGTQLGTLSAKCQLVSEGQLQVRVEGKTLFAGWTVPIRLNSPGRILPPACMLIESYGETKTAIRKSISPSGRMQISMFTLNEASLSLLHPSSEYFGPGTDAFLHRDVVSTTYPPVNSYTKN